MSAERTTLAAAMMNDGVTAFRTSVRGAARGPLCGMGICFECRVSASGAPHERSCLMPRAAGDSPRAEARSLECDVAVVGAGPAGLAAAARAAEAGKQVVMVDASPAPGGQIWRQGDGAAAPRAARAWLARIVRPNVRVLQHAEVIDAPSATTLLVATGDDTVRVHARAIVLATGARELFLPFPGWTLPNVLGVGGVQALAKNGLDVRGKRVVIAGSGPLLLPVAAYLASHGARLAIVAEQARPEMVRAFAISLWKDPARAAMAARMRAAFLRTPYRAGVWVSRADGDDRVREVTLTDGERSWREPCDLLACAFGLIPNTELARLMGAQVKRDGIVADGSQRTTVPGVYAAGECTGVGGAPLAIAEGEIAGLAAAGVTSAPSELLARRARERAFAVRVDSTFLLRGSLSTLAAPDTILCRCEDVTVGEVSAAESSREAKLRTRAGMGACQGRVCGAAMEYLFHWKPAEPRAPLFPASVGALAARDERAR